MAIDTERKRRAAFNFGLVPWEVLPKADTMIEDEDRAMLQGGVYLPGTFPSDAAAGIPGSMTGFGNFGYTGLGG